MKNNEIDTTDIVEIGRLNNLKVVKRVDFGIYLDGHRYGEILLPKRYVPQNCNEGDFINVFLYLDSEDRFIATTETPYAMAGEFAYLKAVASTNVGAFLDWGLIKDLFVPHGEQKQKIIPGQYYMVYVFFDEKSERMVASTKVHKYMNQKKYTYSVGEKVNLIICNSFDLGYNVIINKNAVGAIYKNEIFQKLSNSQSITGYIKKLRPDGKIDVELQKSTGKRENISDEIISYLKSQNGFMNITDKSSPQTIYDTFKVSKKTYKMAIGSLYKKKKITIVENGIKLN